MVAAAAPAAAADKVVLMLNWYVYGEHAPFYYGKAKGIYAADNIDLEIQEGRGSAATTQAVAAKTADFGYVDVPTMMRAAVKGAPIIATGVLLQTSPMSAMGFVDKNIRKPEDIKGKVVAITPADSMTQIWPLFLKKTGLKESDFTTVAGDGQTKLNAVINGQADLLLGYVMDQSMKIKDATGKDVYPIKFADYGINMVSSGLVANTDYVKANPDLVKRFMDATTKAVEAAEKDPKGAAQAILDEQYETCTKYIQNTRAYRRHRPHLHVNSFCPTGSRLRPLWLAFALPPACAPFPCGSEAERFAA